MPPLKGMVVSSPIVPETGVSQVREEIPSRPIPPQLEQREELEEDILQGHSIGQADTLVGLLIFGHSTLPLDGQKVPIWSPATKVPGFAIGL